MVRNQLVKHLMVLASLPVIFSCSAEPKIDANRTAENYQPRQVISDNGIPWGMTWLPGGDMLVAYRGGELKRYDKEFRLLGEVSGLPEIAVGHQGGLLDVTTYPVGSTSPWIYLSYSRDNAEGEKSTAIVRAKLEGTQLVNLQQIYIAEAYSDRGVHFGSRMVFDNDGYLYFAIGDRGQRDVLPQDITRDGGKVYRLHADGRIPANNPFAHLDEAKKAIYSFGHRNPQGMIKHPATGDIWTHEHGPKGGDEVNLIRKGENYGWPVVSFGVNYSGTSFTDLTEKQGMTQPLWHWTPSIAPSGMAFITSDKYPNWQGKIAVGSLKFGYLVFLTLDGDKVLSQDKAFENLLRIRNVMQGPDGYLYVGVDGKGIYRIEAS